MRLLAETAVNIGALYLQMVKVDLFCNCNANVIDVFSITMRYAETAVNIYQQLMHHGEEESELCYYRAIQLKGSIIYQYAECTTICANICALLYLRKYAIGSIIFMR